MRIHPKPGTMRKGPFGLKNHSAQDFLGVKHSATGFTLAELLIALAILGVIATFTIPKVLQAQQNTAWNSAAKEAAASISSAYQNYKLQQTLPTSSSGFELIPLLNYVKYDTSGVNVDDNQGRSVWACGTAAPCLRLHNGGVLHFDSSSQFLGSGSTNCTFIEFDPDGKVTDGTTNGPGKAVDFVLYYDGSLRTEGTMKPGTYSAGVLQTLTTDPPWFSWN